MWGAPRAGRGGAGSSRGRGGPGGGLGLQQPDPPGKRTPGDVDERAGLRRQQLQQPPPRPPRPPTSPGRARSAQEPRTRPRTRPPPRGLTRPRRSPRAPHAHPPPYSGGPARSGAGAGRGGGGGGSSRRRLPGACPPTCNPAGRGRPGLPAPPGGPGPGRVQHRPPPRATHPSSRLLQPKPPHGAWPRSSSPGQTAAKGTQRAGSGRRRGSASAGRDPGARGPCARSTRASGEDRGGLAPLSPQRPDPAHRVPAGSAARSGRWGEGAPWSASSPRHGRTLGGEGGARVPSAAAGLLAPFLRLGRQIAQLPEKPRPRAEAQRPAPSAQRPGAGGSFPPRITTGRRASRAPSAARPADAAAGAATTSKSEKNKLPFATAGP
ncbi:translation initiation factor IF-2-like [Vulpes lagopus]|uniref:translation initiation factor IF-2-like n=1 Tax=Vulpes lagopus TaxID=494514 RepID=UPI001BCA5AED|nr:translation initiation factor IF-2-like [Vulpes lagopus]